MSQLKLIGVKNNSLKSALFLCLCSMLSYALIAQPLNMDTSVHPAELKLFKYEPKGQPAGKGMLNITKVAQVSDTAYYFCKGISIYSPVIVMVSAKDKTQPLSVSLHKWNWKEKSRSGATDAKGVWSEKFKTENDFGIMVVASKKPAIYNMYVWAGDEVKVEVPSDFTSIGEANKKDENAGGDKKTAKASTSANYLLYIIIAALAITVAVLVIKKRKK